MVTHFLVGSLRVARSDGTQNFDVLGKRGRDTIW